MWTKLWLNFVIGSSLFLMVNSDPHAKEVIRAMDKAISDHVAWNDWSKWSQIMGQYFTQDMVYDTNYFDGNNKYLGNGTGIRR